MPPNSERPLVTVIVPIYNASTYLDQALCSIERQTYPNIEIICLNDGSTDDSLDIIRAHAERDPRIIVVDKPNEGYGATCNRGIDMAQGAWIGILEPDDWVEPQMIGDMLAFASRFEGPIDIIKTPFYRVETIGDGEEVRFPCSYHGLVNPPRQPFSIAEEPRLLRHHPSIWSALYNRSFIEEKGIRFMPIPGAGWADNPFLAETLCQADSIVYLDRPYYNYRSDSEDKQASFSKDNPTIPFERWHQMLDIMERLGVHDRRTLRAHYGRGFTYMSGVVEHYGMDDEGVRKLVCDMFARMDPEIVMSDLELAPGLKRLFAEVRGIEGPRVADDARFSAYLAWRALKTLQNTGVKETARNVASYVRRRKRREGR